MSLALALEKVAEHFAPESNQYIEDPVAWVEDVLHEEMWSGQMDLMEACCDNRHVAVRSAHSTGKSWSAARLTAWWLDVHPPGDAFVVTSAPTQTQVEAVLWREIGRTHQRGDLDGRITYGQVPMWKFGNEIVAYGRKPANKVDSEEAMQSFQGIHARFILVILDEACGIPKWLWDAAESLATNQDSRILAIGNPDDPTSHFAKVCTPTNKEGAGWHRMKISAFDTPAFTGEEVSERLLQSLVSETWVQERQDRWGLQSMLYTSKVLAEFPEVSEDTLITPAMIMRAQNAELTGFGPGRFGADIARWGDDETVIMRNREGVVRMVKRLPQSDTMETAGQITRLVLDLKSEAPAVIDTIGIGAGVYDRCREQGIPVIDFNASASPSNGKKFKNLRAEQWWSVRDMFEDGVLDIDPTDDDLAAELTAIKYKIDSAGRIQIEAKDETKKRLGRSPDRADALMMSCWQGASWHRSDRSRRRTRGGITDDLLERAM